MKTVILRLEAALTPKPSLVEKKEIMHKLEGVIVVKNVKGN